jgi:photosystem II stability/assembly factor-like uncharacterized protein
MAEARILYVATADGLIQLANPGKSDRWREIGRALLGQNVRAVIASPTDPLLVFAASQAGVSRSINGGQSWEVIQAVPVGTLAFDQAGTLYAGTDQGAVLSSTDGTSWQQADAFGAPVVQIAALPDDTLLSVGADGTVCERSMEGWVPREVHVPNVRGLVATFEQPHALYIVNQTSLVTPLGSKRLPAAPTGALLLLSGAYEVLLIGTQGLLLRSEDKGATLAGVDGPENVTVLVSPPRFVDQSFAGTANGGLWFSADRGRSWTQLRSGDPPINGVAFARAL